MNDLRKYLDEMKETGHDPRLFVSIVKKYGTLNKCCSELEGKILTAETELNKINPKLDDTRCELLKKQEEEQAVENATVQLRNEHYLLQANVHSLREQRRALIVANGKTLKMT